LLYLAYLAVVTLVSLELLVRVSGYAEPQIYDPIYTSFAGSTDIPYVPKPNLQNARGFGFSVISTDSLGLRSPIPGRRYGAKGSAEFRIAFVGDSGTFGDGVRRTEDTFVYVVEKTLNRKQTAYTVRTFNYGGSGYNVKVMAATLRHRAFEIDPDLVVMVLIVDDLYLGRTPTVDRDGYLTEERLDWLVPAQPGLRARLRRVHLLYPVGRAMSRFDPRRTAALGPLREGRIPETYRYVREFRDIADGHGVPHLIVLRPAGGRPSTGPLLAQARADGLTMLDLSYIRNEFSDKAYRASRFDPHPSAAVHHRIGEELAEHILGSGLLTQGSGRDKSRLP
jgi:hypothetical protein